MLAISYEPSIIRRIMSTLLEARYASEHSPAEVWRAINTPLQGKIQKTALVINPWFSFTYEELDEEGQIQMGTRVVGVPTDALRGLVPEFARSKIPRDMELAVREHSAETRTRVDILESEKRDATVGYRVEEGENGTGLLVVEGEVSLAGLERMIEPQFVEHGIYGPAERLLEHVPELIRHS